MSQLLKTVKSGLTLTSNVLMTVGHFKNKNSYLASGSAAQATSALVQFYEDFAELVHPQQQLVKIEQAIQSANQNRSASGNLTGLWTNAEDGITDVIYHNTSISEINYFARTGTGHSYNIYKGGTSSNQGDINFLVAGYNSRNEPLLISCEQTSDNEIEGTMFKFDAQLSDVIAAFPIRMTR